MPFDGPTVCSCVPSTEISLNRFIATLSASSVVDTTFRVIRPLHRILGVRLEIYQERYTVRLFLRRDNLSIQYQRIWQHEIQGRMLLAHVNRVSLLHRHIT